MADKNFKSFNGLVGTQDLGDLVPPADFAPWSDTLKFSGASDGSVTLTLIQGGLEDCMDANNYTKNIHVHCERWVSGGGQIFTIKGGCNNITISGVIEKHGSVVDIDLDNYSDQSHSPSSSIYFNVRTLDGSPVTWRSLKGCTPIILNPEQNYKCILRLPWIIGIIWDRFYQLLKILKICK